MKKTQKGSIPGSASVRETTKSATASEPPKISDQIRGVWEDPGLLIKMIFSGNDITKTSILPVKFLGMKGRIKYLSGIAADGRYAVDDTNLINAFMLSHLDIDAIVEYITSEKYGRKFSSDDLSKISGLEEHDIQGIIGWAGRACFKISMLQKVLESIKSVLDTLFSIHTMIKTSLDFQGENKLHWDENKVIILHWSK